jgi:hypothetical protein
MFWTLKGVPGSVIELGALIKKTDLAVSCSFSNLFLPEPSRAFQIVLLYVIIEVYQPLFAITLKGIKGKG